MLYRARGARLAVAARVRVRCGRGSAGVAGAESAPRCAVRRERRGRVLHGQVGVERDHLAVGGQQLEDLVLLQDVSVHRVLEALEVDILWAALGLG